jgi:glycosyltransferase involved in cell wall biosynthesis
VVETACALGIDPILKFHLNKHRHPLQNAADKRALKRFLRDQPYDLIHCHLENDHRIAVGADVGDTPIVRSSYEGEGLPVRQGSLLKNTAWIIEPSQRALDYDAQTYGISRDIMSVVPGAIDVSRFDPGRVLPDGRERLGISPDAFVVGIVARMQTHRCYDDLWRAVRMLLDNGADAHVIVVGRGTKQEQVAMTPVVENKLSDNVHFAGFIEGDDYVGMLDSFDAKVFLVPGSDGTCRAVREAMAMGKPVIVADRGMLREMVRPGETGYVCDGSPEELCRHLRDLHDDRARCAAMGEAARAQALAEYALPIQAAAVREVYERLLSRQ